MVEGLAQERLGIFVPALLAAEMTEVREARGQVEMRRGEEVTAQGEALDQERLRPIQNPQFEIDLAHGVQELRLGEGLAPQIAQDAVGTEIENLAHGDGLAQSLGGVGRAQHLDQEGERLARLVPLLGRTALLDQGGAGEDRQPDREHQRRRDRLAVPVEQLAGAVEHAGAARPNRLPAQVAIQVGGQLLDRGIAPLGLLAERHQDDVIQVSAQRSRSPRGACAALAAECRAAGRWRVDLADGAGEVGGRAHVGSVRVVLGEELVEQHAERVHVGRRGQGLAANLLRAGARGREHPGVARRGLGAARDQGRGQELGEPEVEEDRLAFLVDQDVRGLQVAVHHQAAVGVVHGVADLAHQADALDEGEPALRAVEVDGLPVHELGRHVGPAVGGAAGVDQARDARMVQASEHLQLGGEALDHRRLGTGAKDFDRRPGR